MNKYICILLLVFVVSTCSISKKGNLNNICKDNKHIYQLQILSIDTCNDVYSLKCLNINNFDTLFIISLKENIYSISDTSMLSTVLFGGIYTFELKKMKIRISKMQQLGQFIIVKNDTLWKGASGATPPVYYIVENSLGLRCWRCIPLNEEKLINFH